MAGRNLVWLAASEYAISEVQHVSYPNRVLRQAGLLQVRAEHDRELLDLERSTAWALVDHQFSHVFVRAEDRRQIGDIAQRFADEPGIAEVLVGEQLGKYGLDHPRAGEIVLVSEPTSWQAYYWWWDDARAPEFARTVDIHRKPGYDPVELHFDVRTRSIPLDATLVRGSHGRRSRTARSAACCSVPLRTACRPRACGTWMWPDWCWACSASSNGRGLEPAGGDAGGRPVVFNGRNLRAANQESGESLRVGVSYCCSTGRCRVWCDLDLRQRRRGTCDLG